MTDSDIQLTAFELIQPVFPIAIDAITGAEREIIDGMAPSLAAKLDRRSRSNDLTVVAQENFEGDLRLPESVSWEVLRFGKRKSRWIVVEGERLSVAMRLKKIDDYGPTWKTTDSRSAIQRKIRRSRGLAVGDETLMVMTLGYITSVGQEPAQDRLRKIVLGLEGPAGFEWAYPIWNVASGPIELGHPQFQHVLSWPRSTAEERRGEEGLGAA